MCQNLSFRSKSGPFPLCLDLILTKNGKTAKFTKFSVFIYFGQILTFQRSLVQILRNSEEDVPEMTSF